MTKKSYLLIGILLILSLTACTSPTATTPQTQSPGTAEVNPQYPYPPSIDAGNPAYPNPQIQPTSVVIAQPTFTPDPQMGAVTGKLLLKNSAVSDILLYLAEMITDKTGKDVVAGLDRSASPNTFTDSKGSFSFINVKPGRYALILDVVTNQFLINYPENEKPIVINIEAGKVVELGALNYETLPLPPK